MDIRFTKSKNLWSLVGWIQLNILERLTLTTGLVSSISTLPGVEAVAIGNSTFDSNSGKYHFYWL